MIIEFIVLSAVSLTSFFSGRRNGRKEERDEAVSCRMAEYYLDGEHRKQFRWREELRNVVRAEGHKNLENYDEAQGFTGLSKEDTDVTDVKVGDNTPSKSASTTEA